MKMITIRLETACGCSRRLKMPFDEVRYGAPLYVPALRPMDVRWVEGPLDPGASNIFTRRFSFYGHGNNGEYLYKEMVDSAPRMRPVEPLETPRAQVGTGECNCGGPAGHVPNGFWCRK